MCGCVCDCVCQCVLLNKIPFQGMSLAFFEDFADKDSLSICLSNKKSADGYLADTEGSLCTSHFRPKSCGV